jgi:hypothetical protein
MENSQSSTKLPFYHTRLFWGVVIGLQISIFLLSVSEKFIDPKSTSEFIAIIFATIGGAFFSMITQFLPEPFGDIVAMTLSVIVSIYLLHKTFSQQAVKIVYPIAYLLIATISCALTYLFFSAFG